MAPVSTPGPQATSLKSSTRTHLFESRTQAPAKKSFGETFGAATGVSDPRLQGRLCRRNGFFWAGFRATGSRGVLSEEKLKAGIRRTDNSKQVPRRPVRFFLTRRRGERGGKKIGFSPRAPRLRVSRCIPLLQTSRFFTVAEGSRLPVGFFLTRRRGERGGRKIGFSPRAPRLRVSRCIPLLQKISCLDLRSV